MEEGRKEINKALKKLANFSFQNYRVNKDFLTVIQTQIS